MAASLGVLAAGGNPRARALGPPTCEPMTIGLGLENANESYGGAFFGRSVAQVFVAPESLIRAITIWRQPDRENQVPMHLFVGNMSVADSLRPDPLAILLDGPTVVLYGANDEPR